MGRPIPGDEEEVGQVAEEAEAAEVAAEGEAVEGEQVEAQAGAEDAGEQFSAEDIDAALNDHAGWVPEAKFKDVYTTAKTLREDAERYRQDAERARAEAEELRKLREKAEPEKPARNYAQELKDLAAKYDTTNMSMEDYLEARDAIKDAQRDERASQRENERLAKLEKQLQEDRQQREQERVQTMVNREVTAAIARFPFLDQESEDYSPEAMKAVIAERDDLIASGVHPARAIKLAVAAVAPEFGEAQKVANDTTNVAARKIAPPPKTPPNIGRVGAGMKETGGKITLGRSVADAERFEKMTEDQRKNVVFTG